ncbi:hypothetical protein FH972_024442 [Carpinus fangiana]|uniref:Squalene/phytoene synthase n=1 Tax=Carpinus fangiana TaxID=176857 RepID=A0A5N6KYG5_9ROSI|nr:hypothetical protein FH972_024442 [Carpinus fangiana]
MNTAPTHRLLFQNGVRARLAGGCPLQLPSLRIQGLTQRRNYTPPVLAGVTEAEVNAAREHCANLLRRFDAPAHTLQTFIPPSARDAYLALRAFNIDVARVADVTSNAAVGAMRMQFWRDAVDSALSFTPRKEPVVVLLSAAAAQLSVDTDGTNRLSKSWLHRIVTTREKYLHNAPYPDMAALESYAENTYSTLMYLTLAAVPVQSVAADHLASHIGKAQGIAAVLRGLPLVAFPPPPNHHSNQQGMGGAQGAGSGGLQGAVMLPLDVMAEAGVRENDVLRKGSEAAGLRDAVFAVATRANDHLITAREMLKSMKAGQGAGHDFEHAGEAEHQYSEAGAGLSTASGDGLDRGFGVFMPAVSTQAWLDQLQKCDFDVFNPKLRTTDWRLPWKAYWAFKRRQL